MNLEPLEGINISVECQIQQSDMILALKELGMPTHGISEMAGLSPTKVMKMVFDRRRGKTREVID